MKCRHCGKEIVQGNLYCEHCGAEVLLVPDFDELEEMLPTLVSDEPKDSSEAGGSGLRGRIFGETTKRMTSGVIVALAIVVVISVAVGMYFRSYTYVYGEAERYAQMEQYERAIETYQKALSRRATPEGNLALGIALTKTGDYAAAVEALQEALALDEATGELGEEIYRALAACYVASGNFDAIEALLSSTEDAAKKAVIEEYYIRPPVFSEEGGIYDEDLSLVLTSPDGYAIYYTDDGTAPTTTNSTRYDEPLIITSGKTTIRACCVNAAGTWGSDVEMTYEIRYSAPSRPSATPAGGTYHEPVAITLSVRESDVVIYYTWDGTDPTVGSEAYTGPLTLPEGESTLSAIAINSYGMTSGILRCSYTYIP